MSVAVDKTPEEVGVRLRPRVPAEDTLTVQAPVMSTLTSAVEVEQMSEAEPPEMVPFSQVRAEELEVGNRLVEIIKLNKNTTKILFNIKYGSFNFSIFCNFSTKINFI